MRVLFWYCDNFAWHPAMKTLDDAPEASPGKVEKAVVACVHVESRDVADGGAAETKLVKNAKWLARKWDTKSILLVSFTHLGEEKAEPEPARALLNRAHERLCIAGYRSRQTPYGYFMDLDLQAPGHPLARVYKAW